MQYGIAQKYLSSLHCVELQPSEREAATAHQFQRCWDSNSVKYPLTTSTWLGVSERTQAIRTINYMFQDMFMHAHDIPMQIEVVKEHELEHELRQGKSSKINRAPRLCESARECWRYLRVT